MTSSVAVIRADAGPMIGLGHVRRCLTLVKAMEVQGWQWFLATVEVPETSGILSALGIDTAHRIILDPAAETHAATVADRVDAADLLIVDSYDSDSGYCRRFRPWARKIAVIDDLANRPFNADILLNQNLGFGSTAYNGIVEHDCRLLIGPAYAMIRPAFADGRAAVLADRRSRPPRIARVLISLGATDPDNVTVTALQALADATVSPAIDVVLSSAAPHLSAVRAAVASMPGTRLHVDVDDMAALMGDADIAIGAGGTSTFERCCLGLPTLVIQTAENQARTVAALRESGSVIGCLAVGKALQQQMTEAIDDLARTPEALGALVLKSADICDGLGTARVAAAFDDCARAN